MKKQLVLLFTSAALLTVPGVVSANWEWWDGWGDRGAKKEAVETKTSKSSVETKVEKSVSNKADTDENSKASAVDSSTAKSTANVEEVVSQKINTGKRSSNWNWWDGWDNSTSKKEAPAETKHNIADMTASTKTENSKTKSTKVESTKNDTTKQNIVDGNKASGNWWSNWGKTTQAKGSTEIKQHKADAIENTKVKNTEETTKVSANSHENIQAQIAIPYGSIKAPGYIVAPSFEKQQILMEGMRKQHEAMALFIAKQQKIAAETFKKYQASAPVAPQAPVKDSK